MPRRYQYQPLTGPVWRAPVAETLAWLPGGNPYWTPAAPPRDAWIVLEPILAAAVPFDEASLTWLPSGAGAVRAPRVGQGWILLDPLPITPAFDPAGMQWVLQGAPRALERRVGGGIIVLDPLPQVTPPTPPGDLDNRLWQESGPQWTNFLR